MKSIYQFLSAWVLLTKTHSRDMKPLSGDYKQVEMDAFGKFLCKYTEVMLKEYEDYKDKDNEGFRWREAADSLSDEELMKVMDQQEFKFLYHLFYEPMSNCESSTQRHFFYYMLEDVMRKLQQLHALVDSLDKRTGNTSHRDTTYIRYDWWVEWAESLRNKK